MEGIRGVIKGRIEFKVFFGGLSLSALVVYYLDLNWIFH